MLLSGDALAIGRTIALLTLGDWLLHASHLGAMDLTSTYNIPGVAEEENIVCVGALSTSEKYVTIALSDCSLHVFSLADGSHRLRVADPCNQVIWAHTTVGDMLIAGGMDGFLRAWDIRDG